MEGTKGQALTAGTRVGRYRLGERIGGGFGVVYEARDPSGARFALKTLRHADGAEASQEARLLREARVAADIDHPAIVPVLDTGVLDDGRPYLVMPLLDGRTLQQTIEEDGPLEPERAWRVLREIAEALARAHAAGIVHRDVKPSNIFLAHGPSGEPLPKLLDFGLAHALESPESEELVKLTQSGVLIGTPAYMAPEMWWGQPASASMDQYVFGATLFEALTGRPPFAETALRRLMEQTLHAPPPSAIACGAAISEAAEALIKRLLAKDPADRFPSMDAAIAAGDSAFGASANEHAKDHLTTLAAANGASASDAPKAHTGALTEHKHTNLWLWHGAVLAIGLGVLVGVGYAGSASHDVVDWMHIGGFAQFGVLFWFVLGAILLPIAAQKRPGEIPRGALAWTLAPAVTGALGVYSNWRAVERGLLRERGLDAFRIFCEGTYESNAARFVGFAFSAILCTSLVALPGAAQRGRRAASSIPAGPPLSERRARSAALLALAALAPMAAFLGAPSGAWIAAMSALCLAGSSLFSVSSARAEIGRAVATMCAVGLALAVGIARVEARQAVLWSQTATRAQRVAEILGAEAELNATLLIGAAAALGSALPLALAIERLARNKALVRPSRAAWAGLLVIAAAIAFDLAMRDRFLRRRAELRAELAPQFATFFHLDPPPLDDNFSAGISPRKSTGLQVGRDAVAINGKGIAKLAALDTETGTFHATAALHQALAQAAVERGESEIDLTVTADEDVPFGKIALLLSLARAGGARHCDLLFRLGPKPSLSTEAPPEASYVVPSDFRAVPVELADEGFTAPPSERWATASARLLREAEPGSPVRLRAR